MALYDVNGNEITFESTGGNLITVKKNNTVLVNDFLSVAQTYLNQNSLVYRDGDTIMYKSTATNGIDCSTYAWLCLMGYDFQSTPYYTELYKSPDSWVANVSNHKWAINARNYKISRYEDGSEPNEVVHLACQFARWMEERNQVVPLTNGFIDVLPGDVIFWARKDIDTGEWMHPTWYKKINHIGFVLSKEDAPNTYIDGNGNTQTWDKTKYPYKHTIIDVRVETPPCQTLHWLEEGQEDPTNVYKNNVNTVVMVCRPDFGALQSD